MPDPVARLPVQSRPVSPTQVALDRREIAAIPRVEALIGLIGVVVGWAGGSSYSFWATRRAELAAAVIATAVLEGEMGRVAAGFPAPDLSAAWNDHREALVQHLRPDDYQRLAAAVERIVAADATSLVVVVRAVVADLARIFWNAHQAFILTPLIGYLRRETLSKRLNRAMDRSGILEAPEAPSDVQLSSAFS